MLGYNLRKIRKRKKIKAEEVAEFLGIGLSEYYKYEQGMREISFSTAIKLADKFGVTLDYLANLDKIKANPYSLDESSTSILNYLSTEWLGDFNSMVRLIGTYASMPVDMRKDVAEHDILMFVNGIDECNEDLIKYINVDKCIEIVNRLKK